jgi:hypothetical protein
MKSLAALATVAALAGCYRTQFALTPPTPSVPSAEYDGHFHFSVLGFIEISAPVDLAAACGGGPVAAIHEDIGILGGIANAVFSTVFPILHVHNATVYCAVGGAQMGPSQGPPGM